MTSLTQRNPNAVLGVAFSPLRRAEVVKAITAEPIPPGSGTRTVVTANLDHVVTLNRRGDFREAYDSAWAATADGMPVYIYARLRGAPISERLTGADLFHDLMGTLSPERHRCYFVAGSVATALRLTDILHKRGFPRRSTGWSVPPFGFEADQSFSASLAYRIRSHRTTHLFMGVGAPKSEVWTHTHRQRLGDCYALSVGAALDFFVGARKRAPLWAQNAGLEWCWRFAQEPVRMFPRYFVSSWAFLAAISTDLMRGR